MRQAALQGVIINREWLIWLTENSTASLGAAQGSRGRLRRCRTPGWKKKTFFQILPRTYPFNKGPITTALQYELNVRLRISFCFRVCQCFTKRLARGNLLASNSTHGSSHPCSRKYSVSTCYASKIKNSYLRNKCRYMQKHTSSTCNNALHDLTFNPLALELGIYSLAHHLCKMWIFYEPRRITLGNTRHFVEE
jgi:hypothetical protein